MQESDVKSTYGGPRLEFGIWKKWNFLNSLSDTLKMFDTISDKSKKKFKVWRVVLVSIQNVTRCIFFYSKSDALYFLF